MKSTLVESSSRQRAVTYRSSRQTLPSEVKISNLSGNRDDEVEGIFIDDTFSDIVQLGS